MIYYDSHHRLSLLKLRGSVLPKAMIWAMPSALLSLALKYAENEGYISLDNMKVLLQGDIYSGFTYVLGFSLVFRTSQSYLRYWTAATSIHEMSSEWSDSCASIIAFATTSRSPLAEIQTFNHTVVRLFSLLHATALAEIASIQEELPLIDIQGLGKEELLALASSAAQGRKVQIVLCWIKTLIVKMNDKGLLSVPAPILTRVFQELGSGLVNFHKSQQIVIWPFPFPYTQLNMLLIQIYTLITPLVVTTWDTWAWMCFAFTFISVTCMVGLDLIASELENPFGDDPNDLPVMELQRDMNKFLAFQLAPVTHCPPELQECANMDYRALIMATAEHGSPASQKPARFVPRANSIVELGVSVQDALCRGGDSKLRQQMRWRGEHSTDEEISIVKRWLGFHTSDVHHDHHHWEPSTRPSTRASTQSLFSGSLAHEPSAEEFKAQEVDIEMSNTSFQPVPAQADEKPAVLEDALEASLPATVQVVPELPVQKGMAVADWSPFLTALHDELREHMDQQLDMQRREIEAIESLLIRIGTAPCPSDSHEVSDSESEPERCAHLPAPLPRPKLLREGIMMTQSDEAEVLHAQQVHMREARLWEAPAVREVL